MFVNMQIVNLQHVLYSMLYTCYHVWEQHTREMYGNICLNLADPQKTGHLRKLDGRAGPESVRYSKVPLYIYIDAYVTKHRDFNCQRMSIKSKSKYCSTFYEKKIKFKIKWTFLSK